MMEALEKTLYYDGIAFMRYSLAYPSGEEFSFAEEMTRTYAAYLEEDYFVKLCAIYDADTERRKRYRHKIIAITQTYKLYREETLISLCFHVRENQDAYAFAFTWDSEKGIVMSPFDFGVRSGRLGRKKSIFYDGEFLYVFSKKGNLINKILINDRGNQSGRYFC